MAKDKPKPEMESAGLKVHVMLVPHGYQIDMHDVSGKRLKSLGSVCRDFGGNYSPKEMLTTIGAGFATVMNRAEFHHRRAERFAGLSQEQADALASRCRLIRRDIVKVLSEDSMGMSDITIGKLIRRMRSCLDQHGEKSPTNAEIEGELELLRTYGVVELTKKGYVL